MDSNKIKQAIEYAKQNPDSQYATELRKRIESGALDKELHSSGFSQYATQPQQDGIVKSIAKDAINTLLVKPAARATEAITRVAAPNSLASQGYEQMAQEGQSQNIGGVEVSPVKAFGEGGGKQIAGETLKVGSYLFPYGTVAKGAGAVAKSAGAGAGSKVIGNIASGVSGGYMADVSSNIEQDKENVFTPGLGTAIGVALPGAGATIQGVKKLSGKINPTETVENTLGRILQGKTDDIPKAQKTLANIDTTGVKTREELSQRIKDAKEKLMQTVDTELAKDTRVLPLDNYSLVQTNKAGEQVKTNVVQNAFNDLKELFSTTGDDLSVSNLNLLEQKAKTEGLTRQEVNNIARMYSQEFGSKAFNKIGDPLTSVNAQRFENTRKALKDVSRMDDEIGKTTTSADRLYSAMENTQQLIDKGVEGVNKLQQRVKERGLLEKLARNTVNTLNTLSGGTLKGAASAVFPSNVGLKTLNWLDLEKQLAKDLELVTKANATKTDSELIKVLNKFKFPGDMAVDDINKSIKDFKKLPNKEGGFIKNPLADDLVSEAKKYKSAEEFVKAQEAPKTVQVWNKSKFSNEGAYTERPVIRKVENKTLYQGGDDSRQFWTPDKKYAEQFGDVKEKTGTFYQIDNGNRVTEVYVDASKTKSQLTDIWKKSNQQKPSK